MQGFGHFLADARIRAFQYATAYQVRRGLRLPRLTEPGSSGLKAWALFILSPFWLFRFLKRLLKTPGLDQETQSLGFKGLDVVSDRA